MSLIPWEILPSLFAKDICHVVACFGSLIRYLYSRDRPVTSSTIAPTNITQKPTHSFVSVSWPSQLLCCTCFGLWGDLVSQRTRWRPMPIFFPNLPFCCISSLPTTSIFLCYNLHLQLESSKGLPEHDRLC